MKKQTIIVIVFTFSVVGLLNSLYKTKDSSVTTTLTDKRLDATHRTATREKSINAEKQDTASEYSVLEQSEASADIELAVLGEIDLISVQEDYDNIAQEDHEESSFRELTKNCVRANGFPEYQPQFGDPNLMSKREYASRYGYGISTYSKVQLVGTNNYSDSLQDQIVNTCMEQEFEASVNARVDRSLSKVINDSGINVADYANLESYLENFPEISVSIVDWSNCMSSKGFQFNHPKETATYFESKVGELGDMPPLLISPGDGIQDDEDLEIAQRWVDLEPMLDMLAVEELKTADADEQCKESTLYPTIISMADKL